MDFVRFLNNVSQTKAFLSCVIKCSYLNVNVGHSGRREYICETRTYTRITFFFRDSDKILYSKVSIHTHSKQMLDRELLDHNHSFIAQCNCWALINRSHTFSLSISYFNSMKLYRQQLWRDTQSPVGLTIAFVSAIWKFKNMAFTEYRKYTSAYRRFFQAYSMI